MDQTDCNLFLFGNSPRASSCFTDPRHGSKFFRDCQGVAVGNKDDGCGLVLGLGPMPDLYSDKQQSSGMKLKDNATLFGQNFATTDPGILRLGLDEGNADAVLGLEMQPRNKLLFFPVADEGSTSAKRKSGGYMPSLLFAPRSEASGGNGVVPETQDLLHFGDDTTIHLDSSEQQLQFSSEPSGIAECSIGASSDVVCGTSAGDHRNNHRHPKNCRFRGCLKGARGASGLCIAHGGGQRCQKLGCNKGAESRTAYCKAHGGGRRCEQLGCTKSAEGKTDFCIAHGGGRRCGKNGCTKAARGKSGLCIRHGGGKRCMISACTRSAEGKAGLCISHGGGRRCQHPDCQKGAQGSTMYCKAHGGGRRCIFEGCMKGAEGSTPLCKGHGGGKRCLYEGGGLCPKSVHGGTSFCVAHGGGKRCAVSGCTKSARGRTDFCVKHGGGKRCKFEKCGKSAQGSTDFCKAHGGGKRCIWNTGCEKFARGKSGLCAAHGSLMRTQLEGSHNGKSGGLVGPGLLNGIIGMNRENSSSALSTLSDCCNESPDCMARRQALIPPQVLVPPSMKSSSPTWPTQPSFGFVVPEGRVHGGGLMSLLGGTFRSDDTPKP